MTIDKTISSFFSLATITLTIVGLVYGNYWRYNESGFFKKKKLASKKPLPYGKITDTLLKEYSVGILTVVIKKKLIKNKKTIFDTNFDMLSDMDFILKYSKDHKFGCVQEPVATCLRPTCMEGLSTRTGSRKNHRKVQCRRTFLNRWHRHPVLISRNASPFSGFFPSIQK